MRSLRFLMHTPKAPSVRRDDWATVEQDIADARACTFAAPGSPASGAAVREPAVRETAGPVVGADGLALSGTR